MTTAAIQDATTLRELAEQSNAWPFEEARKIVARLKKQPKDEVIFETGYGPSGLPHIGTFGEVARTSMVRHAFRVLTDDKIKTRLIAFSDDMDALRKVPDNVPNRDLLEQHIGQPLTRVPDPFGTHDSFGAHNNARLRAFLDQFGFEYEFLSATQCYTSGRFDAALMKVLVHFEQVMAIMLPSLREERAQTYSPFLPLSPQTGAVLQVPVTAHDAKAGTITYQDPDSGEPVTTPVTGGRCKLQWKPDWAMRWVALGIDYEMAGKDLIELGQIIERDLPRARRPAAGRLQLRTLPRRERPKNLQVEGQRPDHRRVAALRQPRKPVAVHVPRAQGGEAALFRRHPAPRRRVCAVPRGLRPPGPARATV